MNNFEHATNSRSVTFLTHALYFQGHPILEPKEHCAIHIRWLTSAACANGQKEDLDKCRVYDNHTKEYYDLNALAHASSGLKYFTVVCCMQ